ASGGSKTNAREAPPAPKPHAIDAGQVRRTLAQIREAGVRAGLAIRPDSGFEEVEPFLGEVDLLLVMTVYPGFSGQPFLEDQLGKIEQAAAWKRERGASFLIEVDGGVAPGDTGSRVARAGADVIVSGHGVYRAPDPVAAMRALKALP